MKWLILLSWEAQGFLQHVRAGVLPRRDDAPGTNHVDGSK